MRFVVFFVSQTDMKRYCTLVIALTFYTSHNILQLGMINHTHKSFHCTEQKQTYTLTGVYHWHCNHHPAVMGLANIKQS